MTRTKSIRISTKHGVNPAIPHCYYCNKPKNEIILAGALPGDAEAPRGAVWDKRPCDECAALMSQGVMLISVRDGEERSNNPHRTGRVCVVRDDYVRRTVNDPRVVKLILECRYAFLEDSVWKALGLPTTNIDNRGGQ